MISQRFPMIAGCPHPRIARALRNLLAGMSRAYSPSILRRAQAPSTFSVVEKCPAPTCYCVPTPAFPGGLEINFKTNINGLIPTYAEQVLICTGKDDWESKIEEENGGDNLAADLKELFGRGGEYRDVSQVRGSQLHFLSCLFKTAIK